MNHKTLSLLFIYNFTTAVTLLCGLLLNLPLIGQVRVNLKGISPEPVLNNAFCEGYLQDMPFVFSFGGSTLEEKAAINFRYNALTGEIKELPPFPDGQKHVGAKASLVNNIVFVVGGKKDKLINSTVYRYDQTRHVFLSNGEPIPYPVAHHGQAKYRDSLLFVIGGQIDSVSVNKIQIYNPLFDSWTLANALPDLVNGVSNPYFSAVILEDTLHVLTHLGTANSSSLHLFTAVVPPTGNMDLKWSHHPLGDSLKFIPPFAGTVVRNQVQWLASEEIPGTGRIRSVDFSLDKQGRIDKSLTLENIPGKINSIARVSDTIQFIVGGVYPEAGLNDNIYMLTWTNLGTGTAQKIKSDRRFYLYPNPCQDYLRIQSVRKDLEAKGLEIYNMQGKKLLTKKISNQNARISFRSFTDRAFIVRIFDNEGSYYVDKVLKD